MKSKDSQLLAEAYSKVLKEDEAPMSQSTSGKSVYVIVDTTPYEFDVHGIYSSRALAERALEEFAREQGDNSRYEVTEVALDQKPTYNYINF
jgi:hypothetical protein